MKLFLTLVFLAAACSQVAGTVAPTVYAASVKKSATPASSALTLRVRLTDGTVKRVQAAPGDSIEDVCSQLECDYEHGIATDAELTSTVDLSATLKALKLAHGDWLYIKKDPSEKARDNTEIIKRLKKKRQRELKQHANFDTSAASFSLQGGGVIECNTLAKLDKELKDAGNMLVCVDFFATWCGPCKTIAPKFKAMAEEFPKAVLLKVDVDQNKDASERYSVSSMPTFVFIKNGKVLDTIKGADEATLKAKLKSLS
eukprot:13568-Heterococcus_DN1.PRE.3